MVRDRLAQDDTAGGFLLDGYPRTVTQAQFLDHILANKNQKLDVVLQISADDDELVSRLLKRAAVDGRTDDTETIIRHRLNLYHRQTEAVVSHYEQHGLLTSVDGTGPVEEITESLIEATLSGRKRRSVSTA
jgi:adenylate kinase